jgi:hypothetical protein
MSPLCHAEHVSEKLGGDRHRELRRPGEVGLHLFRPPARRAKTCAASRPSRSASPLRGAREHFASSKRHEGTPV